MLIGSAGKEKIVEQIKDCCTEFKYIYTFSVENPRNNHLKHMRSEWSHSKFFMGKNKVMAMALGRTPEEEMGDDLHKLANSMHGEVGLLFTNKNKKEVEDFIEEHTVPDFPRSGTRATSDFDLEEGPLELQNSMEVQLRKLGLPTALDKGKLILLCPYRVIRAGEMITVEQSKLL
eukprot:Pgem_evm1s1713